MALADLLCLEDLEVVGKLVGRLVGGLEMGEVVVGVPGSSPSPQMKFPGSLISSPQVKPAQKHLSRSLGLHGVPSITSHGVWT